MLRFILLSMFLVETVILAPNTNFVALPATEADVCADCETQCANCNFLQLADSETSTRVKRNVGSILKNETYALAWELENLAKAMEENVGGFFTYLSWTHQPTIYVSSIKAISREVRDLNNYGYNVQTMTEQLASRIVRANIILNEIANVTMQRSKTQNGGAALKSMASNIERLSGIIKVLGKGIQETETNCLDEKNNLQSTITKLEKDVNELKARKTELIEVEIKNSKLQLEQKDQEIKQLNSTLETLQSENSNLESLKINKTKEINELNDVVANKENSINNLSTELESLRSSADSNITKLQNDLEILQNKNSQLESAEINKTKEISELNVVVAIKENSIENLNTSLESLKSSTDSEITKLQNNVTDLDNKFQRCNEQQNKLDELSKELAGKLKDAISEKVKLEEEIESNLDEIKVMQASMVNLEEQLEGNERLIDNLLEANMKYISKIVKYEETIEILKNKSAVFAGDSKVYEALIAKEQKTIKKNEQKIEEIKGENDKLEKEKEDLQSKIDKELLKVKNLEDNLEKYKTEINDSNLTVKLLKTEKEDLVKNIIERETNLQQALATNHNFDKENVALRNLNSKYLSDIEYLGKQLAQNCNSNGTV